MEETTVPVSNEPNKRPRSPDPTGLPEFDFNDQATWQVKKEVAIPKLLDKILAYGKTQMGNEPLQDYCRLCKFAAGDDGPMTWKHVNVLESAYNMVAKSMNFNQVVIMYGSTLMGAKILMSGKCKESDIPRRHASVSPSKDPNHEFIESLSRQVLRFDHARVHVVTGESGSGKTYSAITECFVKGFDTIYLTPNDFRDPEALERTLKRLDRTPRNDMVKDAIIKVISEMVLPGDKKIDGCDTDPK
eukprot:PhF_6_TR42380/c0_g1_i1/m.63932